MFLSLKRRMECQQQDALPWNAKNDPLPPRATAALRFIAWNPASLFAVPDGRKPQAGRSRQHLSGCKPICQRGTENNLTVSVSCALHLKLGVALVEYQR